MAGTDYYRLKMIDLDGSAVYSGVKVIQSAAVSHISFFPNPARDFVNVTPGGVSMGTVSGLYIISVSSADGMHESSKLLISKA